MAAASHTITSPTGWPSFFLAVPSSFGTKQDVNQLGSEAPYPTCSLATANKHLSTGARFLFYLYFAMTVGS